METKTGVKIFFLIVISVWFFFVLSNWGDPDSVGAFFAQLFLGFLIPLGLIVYLCISIINDYKRSKENRINQLSNAIIKNSNLSLTRQIITIVSEIRKPLSVYDFMIKIHEPEERIEKELDIFVNKGLANKKINEKGLVLYEFNLIPRDMERNDILE